jgi:hypothetical protein
MNLLETLDYYNLDHGKTVKNIHECPFGTNKEMCGYISMYYNDLFDNLKDYKLKFVEIGSWLGGSLLLWEKFFTNGEIVGIDPNPDHQKLIPLSGVEGFQVSTQTFTDYLNSTEKIKFYKENAYDVDFIEKTFEDESIDILLDDGPHTEHFQKLVTDVYFKKVKVGGMIIIEDIIQNDINSLLKHYKNSCPNSDIQLSFDNSPWDKKLYNVITIKKN